MPRRFFSTVGVALAVVLSLPGCAEDPSSPAVAADGGGPDAQADASPEPQVIDESLSEPDAAPPPSSVGDCCETQSSAGCEDPTIEACVCAVDRLCCAGAWDERCVALIESEACGRCGAAPSTACEVAAASEELPSALHGTLGTGDVTDAVELSCGSIAEPDVLFAFTAPEAGSYELTTAGSSVTDTVMAVIDGEACGGDELGCNDDDDTELSSRLTLELDQGQSVLIAVESWGEESGDVTVQIAASGGSSPLDDDSCVASALEGTPASAAGDASAESDLITPSCALYGSAGEAFYTFTAAEEGRYRFDTRGSDADTIVQVLDGTCTAAELACNDDSDLGGLAAVADLDLSAGQTVLVNVDSLDGTGSYTLSVGRVDPSAEEPEPASGSCCAEHPEAGCDDSAISACVCAVDDYCCTQTWDELCVDAIATLSCGSC